MSKSLLVIGILVVVVSAGCAMLEGLSYVPEGGGEPVSVETSIGELAEHMFDGGVTSTGVFGLLSMLAASVGTNLAQLIKNLRERGVSTTQTQAIEELLDKVGAGDGNISEEDVKNAIRRALGNQGVRKNTYRAYINRNKSRIGR